MGSDPDRLDRPNHDDPTMPLLTILHKTEYRYAREVAFGEHRIMLRPRDGHDLRVLQSRLDITPEPMRLRWIHDVFGNSVAIAVFDERADVLTFTSHVTVEHNPAEEFALTPDDPAYFYPFLYDAEEFPDLRQYITPQYADPDGELAIEHTQIVAVARAQHDSVLAERNRAHVAIFGLVMDL